MKKIALVLATLTLFAALAFAADIEMQPVESSFISAIGYDAAAETLAVQMHNSLDTYLYEGVPASVFEEFRSSDSKGRYFVENIKGQYKTDRD
jgi:hypothetical protein